jgi:hypothetical protein
VKNGVVMSLMQLGWLMILMITLAATPILIVLGQI